MQARPLARFRPPFLLSSLEAEAGSPVGAALCPGPGRHPPPLLLLQLVVADLLALQVQLGVLQLSCQPLALLLELLQSPLALVTVCLQVSELGPGWGAGSVASQTPGSTGREGEEGEGAEGGTDPGMKLGTSKEPKTLNRLPLGVPSPRG